MEEGHVRADVSMVVVPASHQKQEVGFDRSFFNLKSCKLIISFES